MFMDWLSKKKESAELKKSIFNNIPDGLWVKCPQCNQIIYSKDWLENYKVCIKCGYHSQLTFYERIALLTDEGSFKETDENIISFDILGFHDTKSYSQRLMEAQLETNLKEAVITGFASIEKIPVNLIVMDFRFIGGSMGSVVGEKVTRVIERSIDMKLPLISVIASGGARMQEGLISLFQMAKTSSAIGRLDKEKILYICILTHPSTAGVLASFGSLGDIIIAEPGALIGFAGPRVIEQTIKQKLPANFQKAEFVLQHGMIDTVVERKKLKSTVALILRLLWRKK